MTWPATSKQLPFERRKLTPNDTIDPRHVHTRRGIMIILLVDPEDCHPRSPRYITDESLIRPVKNVCF
jgi:hypothetical protein